METNQNTAVHPSRSAKSCRDCRYPTAPSYHCNHPSLPVCIINGHPTTSCLNARKDEGPCGKDAALFQDKQERVKRMINGVRTWVYIDQENAIDSINPQANHPEALAA